MDNVEVLYFSEEIHEMSEKLGSIVAHLDAKSTGVQRVQSEVNNL